MRTADEINELAFLAQEAINLGATKYPDLTIDDGIWDTKIWLAKEFVQPLSFDYTGDRFVGGGARFEKGIMVALQESGHCIPNYEVSIDPNFTAYVEGKNELD